MVTGRLFEFEEARDMGLVSAVVEAADAEAFLEAVRRKAREFLPPARTSKAVGLIKRAVQTGAEVSFTDALGLERELQQQLFESEDAREGLAAHLEKRKPAFKGR
jgi:enoyl-CoA hydratase/carnithine racemase